MSDFNRDNFKEGQTVFVMDGANIVTAALLQLKTWTQMDQEKYPNSGIEVGGMVFYVELHSIAENANPHWILPKPFVYAHYEEAEKVWQTLSRPANKPFHLRSPEYRRAVN